MNIANIFNYLSIDVLPKRHLFQDEKRFTEWSELWRITPFTTCGTSCQDLLHSKHRSLALTNNSKDSIPNARFSSLESFRPVSFLRNMRFEPKIIIAPAVRNAGSYFPSETAMKPGKTSRCNKHNNSIGRGYISRKDDLYYRSRRILDKRSILLNSKCSNSTLVNITTPHLWYVVS